MKAGKILGVVPRDGGFGINIRENGVVLSTSRNLGERTAQEMEMSREYGVGEWIEMDKNQEITQARIRGGLGSKLELCNWRFGQQELVSA